MSRKMCKMTKSSFKKKDIISVGLPAKYICTKCGHFANDDKFLCKPEKI